MAHQRSGTPYDKAVGRRIRRFREALGWSLDTLAARLSETGPAVTGSQIAKKERGEEQITIDFIRRAADALQINKLDLMEEGPLAAGEHALATRIGGLAEPDREAIEQLVDRFAERMPAVRAISRAARR